MMNGIAIDGPAGAGKSTLAKLISEELHLPYVDTGAMYRAVALAAKRGGTDMESETACAALLQKTDMDVTYLEDGQHVFINGEDVTPFLRTEEMGKAASLISKLRCVRDKLSSVQREIAHRTGAVLDGREIGTFVIPDTPHKFYVTADAEERALRRLRQLREKNETGDYEQILKDIIARDKQDMERDYAPLKQAEDAILIDTTHMSIREAADVIISHLRG